MTLAQTWNAEEYHTNSMIQHEAAKHLIDLLDLKGYEHILDVGCGDGKITTAIAKTLKNGHIVGIDFSEEMIKFARSNFLSEKTPNLDFLQLDAQSITYYSQFDIIFSSFALQWLPGIDLFFDKAFKALKKHGRIAFTLPFGSSGISNALDKSLRHTIRNKLWRSYFSSFKLGYYLHEKKFIENLVSKHKFTKAHLEVVNQKWQFASRQELEQYIITWLPHIRAIPLHLQELFFKQVIDLYIEISPFCNEGKLNFEFQRIDLVGLKNND